MSDNATARAPLILLTRPRATSEGFAEALHQEIGPVAITIAPLMEIVATGALPDLEQAAGLIFTSAAGVEAFGAQSTGRDLPAWCVGTRTAKAAQAIGLKATAAGGDADALVALLRQAAPQGRLVHLCGTHQRGDVAERLCAAGLKAESAVIYDQRAVAPDTGFFAALAHPGPVIVPLFSPRSAELFLAAAAGAATVNPIALSAAVRAALPPAMAAHSPVADSPDAPAMIRAIKAEVSRHSTA